MSKHWHYFVVYLGNKKTSCETMTSYFMRDCHTKKEFVTLDIIEEAANYTAEIEKMDSVVVLNYQLLRTCTDETCFPEEPSRD